jgi:hypothetical protein
MTRTVKIGVSCANPKCDAGFVFGEATINPKRFGDVTTWAIFPPKYIVCRKCGHGATYTRDQLVELPPNAEEYF